LPTTATFLLSGLALANLGLQIIETVIIGANANQVNKLHTENQP
jgi:hypothetical protein